MKEKLSVAVIGAGRWSTTAHLPGFVRSPLCEVVVLCDLDREMAERKAKMFNIPEVETDYEKVFIAPILILSIRYPRRPRR